MMIELAVPSRASFSFNPFNFDSIPSLKRQTGTRRRKTTSELSVVIQSFRRTVGVQHKAIGAINGDNKDMRKCKKRVFFLDVNPLCYEGSAPSLESFGRWVSLFFNQVSCEEPVIAVSESDIS